MMMWDARSTRATLVGVLLATLFLLSRTALLPAAPQEEDLVAVAYGHTGETELYVPPSPAEKALASVQVVEAHGITWVFTYHDQSGKGFNDPERGQIRRDTMAAVASYVSSVIDHPGGRCEIEVRASQFDGSGALATAGTLYLIRDGFYPGFMYEHLTTGVDPRPTSPDMRLTVDFGWNWNDELRPPAEGELDFYSVMLHEIFHGMGFNSLSEANGDSIFREEYGRQTLTTFDNMLYERNSGKKTFNSTTFAFEGTGLAGGDFFLELRSEGAKSLYPTGGYPLVHSPSNFVEGRSISHWQAPETPMDAVMRYSVPGGERRRRFQGYERALLGDLGYKLRPEGSPEMWLMY